MQSIDIIELSIFYYCGTRERRGVMNGNANDAYQLSIDDINKQEMLESQPLRYAYIDECGCFGFDFSAEGTSKHYVLCAVIVESDRLESLRDSINEIKKKNGLSQTEMKSSKIGRDTKRRTRIISQLLAIDFRVVLFVANKQEFIKGSPLTEYKKSFIKFLHQRLYDNLYHVSPKLKIIEDETGTTEFQESFKKYVEERRPQYSLLNDYDFDYCDSKNEALVQLADMIGGSITYYLEDPSVPNYYEMLRGKVLLFDEFPSKHEPFWGTVSPEECKFNKDIYSLAVKCATDFIKKYESEETDDRRAQIAFLRYLLFQVQNVDPAHYIYSGQIISILREYTQRKISRNFLYRKVIAPLRDAGVIIASSSHGYKIPISVEDIKTYLNSTNAIVSPMLHRIEICRKLIKVQTSNELDVLDDPAYLRFKKYFD